jgi:flagellar hook-associated protein 3 FlgL
MTSISTMGQAIDQMERIKQVQTLFSNYQAQVTTGKKTNLFKGLGIDVLTSERSRADLDSIEIYKRNIDIADRRLKLMNNAVEEMKAQAINVQNAITVQTQQGEIELDTIHEIAQSVYTFLVDLVNSKDGDRYLFSGSDTQTKPIVTTSLMTTYMTTRVDEWVNGTIDTNALITSYTDDTVLVDATVGYAATLSNAGNVFVRADDTKDIDYTVLGNDPAIRDLIVSIGMTANLTGALDEITLDPDDPPTTVTAPGATVGDQSDNFYRVFNQLAAAINTAIDDLDTIGYRLSGIQAQLDGIGKDHQEDRNNLMSVISNVEDADTTEAALKIKILSTQLEASYRVTALLSDLTLTKFI